MEMKGKKGKKGRWKAFAVALGMALPAGCGSKPADADFDGQPVKVFADEGQGGQTQEEQGQGGQAQGEPGQSGQGQDGGRTLLTLGAVGVPWELRDAVDIYNSREGKYRVELVDYLPEKFDDGVWEAAYDRMRMDFATGKGMDIILFGDLVADELGYSGVVLDLNTFLTPEDKQGKYLGNILECAQTGDALYEISPSFTLAFIAGDGSRLGWECGWTMEEMEEGFGKCGRDGAALGKGGVRTVERLVQYAIEDFVDWDAGTANFCNEEFYGILEFGRKTDHGEFVRTTRDSVASGIHLASCEGLGDAAGVQYLCWLFGEDMAVKGYPCARGTGVGVGFGAGFSMGISAYSECPEGAWDFLEFFVGADWIGDMDESYSFSRLFYGFPVNRRIFEEILEQSMVQRYYDDGRPCPLLQGEGDVPDFYANTAEDVEKLREIIALADRRCLPDLSAVGRIIKEEISGYNAGVMTAEQTAEKIQNRVQLYLDEHR